MQRRTFIALVSGGILAAPLSTEAQPATGRHRVGLLNGATEGQIEAIFREALHALGYDEATNLVINARAARGHPERLPILMRELLDAKPDVIVTFGTTAAQTAKAATTTTPIVMAFAGDPVGTRLVSSLANVSPFLETSRGKSRYRKPKGLPDCSG